MVMGKRRRSPGHHPRRPSGGASPSRMLRMGLVQSGAGAGGGGVGPLARAARLLRMASRRHRKGLSGQIDPGVLPSRGVAGSRKRLVALRMICRRRRGKRELRLLPRMWMPRRSSALCHVSQRPRLGLMRRPNRPSQPSPRPRSRRWPSPWSRSALARPRPPARRTRASANARPRRPRARGAARRPRPDPPSAPRTASTWWRRS